MSSNNSGANGGDVEVMELTADSQMERQQHESLLLDLEAKKRAFEVDVPTLPDQVRAALRNIGLPVRLFGENLADVRNRLRMALARQEILREGKAVTTTSQQQHADSRKDAEEKEEVKYTRASQELVTARESIAKFSFARAKMRLDRERQWRKISSKRKRSRLDGTVPTEPKDEPEDEAEISRMDNECIRLYKSLHNFGLEGSQYGDARAMSAITTAEFANLQVIGTGSWSASIKLWDGGSPQLDLVGMTDIAHEDRIMGIALHGRESYGMAATASIDMMAKLWKITPDAVDDDSMAIDQDTKAPKLNIEEVSTLEGHARRLCKVAFHPTGDYVATTSFDHSWRLWSVETGHEILLQDGHAYECYGVGFHPDGSLVATTDFGGVVQNWDLRSGKSICHFLGHAKRVLCAEYSPNGFQLATAGDDGTIKVWDLRKRKQAASLAAHSKLITQLRFSHSRNNSEYLVSSSFDGTVKFWSTRNWQVLSTLKGHEGKVMGVGVFANSVVSCGYDKTLKLWR